MYYKGNKIGYKCETQEGSSGSPIINLNNYNVIGIHCGAAIGKKLNIGEILKLPIIEFYQKYNSTNLTLKKEEKINSNEILITLKIEYYDVDKQIYFLNNIDNNYEKNNNLNE